MIATKSSVKDKKQHPGVRKAVIYFDGVTNLAEKLKIPHSNISRWLYLELKIPIKHAIQIEYLTNGKIKAVELRPDVFKKSLI